MNDPTTAGAICTAGPGDLRHAGAATYGHGPVWPDFLNAQPGRVVRVILIDDDPHIRRVIAGELSADLRIDLIGQADCVRSGKRLISNQEFDAMLVDLNLGNGSGFELIAHMKRVRRHAEAIVISVMDDEAGAMQAFELGATGYLVKSSWFGSFGQAVLQVCNGGASITPSLARRLLKHMGSKAAAPLSAIFDSQLLSQRECEVLKLVALGNTNAEIAIHLSLSVQTIHSHIRNIYRKLHVKSRAQAVNEAQRRRIL